MADAIGTVGVEQLSTEENESAKSEDMDTRQSDPRIPDFPPSDWDMSHASLLSAETHEAFEALYYSLCSLALTKLGSMELNSGPNWDM